MGLENIVSHLENLVGNAINWIAAATGSFHYWATTNEGKGRDYSREELLAGGMCCFYLPLYAAVQTGDLTRSKAGDLIADQMLSGMKGSVPGEWAPRGLTTRFRGCMCWKTEIDPDRGDFVFFSGKIGGSSAKDFAHVAVAIGNGTQTVSFGHDAPYLQGGTHALTVAELSVSEILSANAALSGVHYGAPPWP
jgi:hypothetical protein